MINPQNIPALQQYYDRLDALDWFYEYNDTYTYWKKHSAEHFSLMASSRASEEFKDLYDAMHDHKVNKKPKPQRPE